MSNYMKLKANENRICKRTVLRVDSYTLVITQCPSLPRFSSGNDEGGVELCDSRPSKYGGSCRKFCSSGSDDPPTSCMSLLEPSAKLLLDPSPRALRGTSTPCFSSTIGGSSRVVCASASSEHVSPAVIWPLVLARTRVSASLYGVTTPNGTVTGPTSLSATTAPVRGSRLKLKPASLRARVSSES